MRRAVYNSAESVGKHQRADVEAGDRTEIDQRCLPRGKSWQESDLGFFVGICGEGI